MSVSDTPSFDEPHLSADFAARVLRRADNVIARKRQARRAMAAAALLAVVSVAAFSGLRTSPASRATPSITAPENLADVDAAWMSASSDNENADALDYLFPDAAPLASFADQYATASYDDNADGDAQESEVDGDAG
jgi:hypothetical protein